jgi:hypothetical protein
MLCSVQGQTHLENNTLYYCHTDCNLLNAGTVEAQFKLIADWVAAHPFEVVTLLMGNAGPGLIPLKDYIAPIEKSGLLKYAYRPPKVPMGLADWPTLGEMIISQKRVVIFMDYAANQTAVDYILDEFSQMWETPYSPTNVAFPCNVDRPPNLARNDAMKRLYTANHNLNAKVALSIASSALLIPNTAVINQTNAASGPGSLGEMANTCQSELLLSEFSKKYEEGIQVLTKWLSQMTGIERPISYSSITTTETATTQGQCSRSLPHTTTLRTTGNVAVPQHARLPMHDHLLLHMLLLALHYCCWLLPFEHEQNSTESQRHKWCYRAMSIKRRLCFLAGLFFSETGSQGLDRITIACKRFQRFTITRAPLGRKIGLARVDVRAARTRNTYVAILLLLRTYNSYLWVSSLI